MLRKQELKLRTGFICFKRESRDKLLWTRYWTCGLWKRRGITGLVERMLYSKERVSHMESIVNITHSWYSSRSLLDIAFLTGSLSSRTPVNGKIISNLPIQQTGNFFSYNISIQPSQLNHAEDTDSIFFRNVGTFNPYTVQIDQR